MNENTPAEAARRVYEAAQRDELRVRGPLSEDLSVVLAHVLRVPSPSPVPGDTATEGGSAGIAYMIGSWIVERLREGTSYQPCEGACRHCGSGEDESCGQGCPCWPYSQNDPDLHRLADAVTAGLLATAGTEGEGVSPQQGTLRITNGYVEEWTGTCTCGGEAPFPPYQHEAHCGWEMVDQLASAASPQGEAQGQGEDRRHAAYEPVTYLPNQKWTRLRGTGIELYHSGSCPCSREQVWVRHRAAGAPRAATPVANVDQKAALRAAFTTTECVWDPVAPPDGRWRRAFFAESGRMADVALAALRGDR